MSAPTPIQQQAIAARGNVLVVAGAGTGKTSTLVQRCMTLLEEGGSLEKILLVTFTEAAAVEMRGRIREALQSKLSANSSEPLASNLREHFQKQLALLDSALISTLHSFCMQLVREHFYELGIDPDVSVLDEQQTRPVIQQILDQLFEQHYAGNSERDRAVQRLVRIQGRGSDDTIRGLILKLHRYTQSLAAPERWIETQRAMFDQSEPAAWREWLISGFIEWRALWLPVLNSFQNIPATAGAIDALSNVQMEKPSVEHLATALEKIRSADSEKDNWPRGSKTSVRAKLKKFFEETEFLISLMPKNGTDPLTEDWDLVRHDLLTLLELTRDFSAEFSRIKREMGGVDFADLEQFALRVLRDSKTGELTPAALQWQRQLDYVFVDEYQDINAAQDAILSALSRDAAQANRFLVGDVKQSIYRFRLADPTIFRGYERAWNSTTNSDSNAAVLSLTENFRSREGILEFINPLFGALMRDAIGGVAYEPLTFGALQDRIELSMRGSDSPRVELHLICKSENDEEPAGEENGSASEIADLLVTEREARLVGLRLRELKEQSHVIWDKAEKRFRPMRWSDAAILLRSPSSRVEAFAKEFARLDIPLEAARGGFFESTEISDLISLLQLIDNPLQDIPLLSVLHSPLVGMSFSELAEIRAHENSSNRSKFFWLAARQFHNSQRDSKSASTRSAWIKLNRFFEQLERWRELVRQSSLSHCLETALAETHYEILLRARPRGEQQLANVRRLLDLAREYDPYQRQGLFRFLRFVRAQEETPTEVEPAPAARDAVQLTSIHRSKGLEFPVVVLAGLGWQFNFRDLNESILLDEQFGLCAKISPPESDQRYPSLPHWLARRRQHRELLGEELRLLYVAMTRARDTLVLAGTASRKASGPWESTEPRALSDSEVLSAKQYLDWLKLCLPQVTRAGDWTNEREGKSKLLSWKLYEETDSRLALPEENAERSVDNPVKLEVNESGLLTVQERMSWKYPFQSATEQRAKTSVTELRRGQPEEESETARFVRRNVFTLSPRVRKKLGAAEIGVAHHRFLQRVSLGSIQEEADLQDQAEHMLDAGWISGEEFDALDFESLFRFWKTDLGKSIVANAGEVQRELQFTAGLNAEDLIALKLEPAAGLPKDEVVVVQGVVDLAVIRDKEIWIVDFKTDAVTELELALKIKTYEPQLKLYALALARIYRRPVTRCALYFLATGSVTSIPCG